MSRPTKPEDWTNERWNKYLAWYDKLPGYDPRPEVSHVVTIGKKERKPTLRTDPLQD